MPETNLLVTGDLHLGLHPSKIPEDLDSEAYSPGAAWHRIVEEACRWDVDAVMITGDVVDRENRYFEAWGPFESGLTELSEEDIPVFVVSGNHDAGALASFIESMEHDHVTLLGSGGEWERSTLTQEGDPVLHVDGWSYPTPDVRSNPLDAYDLPEENEPVVGLLHTDLGSTGTTYAPTEKEDLTAAPPDGWFLGHIHKPQLHSERPLILNPGSPQPLNPTETGLHGAWLVSVQSNSAMDVRQVPVANLEYTQVELDVSELQDSGAIAGALKRSIMDELDQREPVNEYLRLLSTRVRLTGRTQLYRTLDEDVLELKQSLQFTVHGAEAYVEQLENHTRPELDLDQLADGSGPVAILARLLLELEEDAADALPEDLLVAAQRKMNDAYSASTYEPLRTRGNEEPPDRQKSVEVIEEQARSLLDKLVAQKEDSS